MTITQHVTISMEPPLQILIFDKFYLFFYQLNPYPYAHPQHIKVLKHCVNYDMAMGCISWGFGALTMTLQHHELMIRDYIFNGNTPKAFTFDVGEYVCSFVGGMGS